MTCVLSFETNFCPKNLSNMEPNMAAHLDDIPQWKKDLIMRRKNLQQNNKQSLTTGNQQLFVGPPQSGTSDALGRSGQQPSVACTARVTAAVALLTDSGELAVGKCEVHPDKMVQERTWMDKENGYGARVDKSDSDSSEDLHYGPGIVNRLKNRYLSLALRENNAKTRPSILHMRRATSLEHLLDEDADEKNSAGNRLFESRLNGSNDIAKNVPNRYRSTITRSSMKRAHSVETISRNNATDYQKPKRESMHEDMLINNREDLDRKKITDPETVVEEKIFTRLNKPKRITPIMNEREKPPVDVVKQAKKIFEGRPEQRTKPPHTTGEVAAKVATYKSIILQTKVNKKPLIKQKPALIDSNRKINHPARLPTTKTTWKDTKKVEETIPKPPARTLPIPDVSKTNDCQNSKFAAGQIFSSLSETPDLILHSSPCITSPTFRIETTQRFIHEEIDNCNRIQSVTVETKSATAVAETDDETEGLPNKYISQESRNNISKSGSSVTFNFSDSASIKNGRTPLNQPLQLEINGQKAANNTERLPKSSPLLQTVKKESVPKPSGSLTSREIEKNLINAVKTLERSPPISAGKIEVPKTKVNKKPPRAQEQNSVVFKFTDRKDIPDYVGNHGQIRSGKMERPKVGEGGIILLPGASVDESFTDDDEELLRSLEGPPSPCDVTFINDNVLIDGRSSLSQKTRKYKMKISFVESVPEIFEYPSETSLLDDTSSSSVSPVGHNIPSLGGTSLANYTPKGAIQTEEFQLGVTRAAPVVTNVPQVESCLEEAEVEQPILFSAGTNSDILF